LHAFDRARAIRREIAADREGSARAIASAKTLAAVERLAKADRRLAATAPQWDTGGWTFNTGDDNDGSCDV
jgi:putative DNA primase/helicase